MAWRRRIPAEQRIAAEAVDQMMRTPKGRKILLVLVIIALIAWAGW